MPSRTVLDGQLARAEQTLALRVEKLEKSGQAAATFSTDPKWRQLNADCSALRRRVRAVEAVVANNAEVARRKEAGDEAAEEGNAQGIEAPTDSAPKGRQKPAKK
ncbi:MAG TPA: hypothetical protein VM165_22785 [Planctomycetaceae bacterium]|nr:hypothetical protein [Planctomycetaceae bacterium]